MCGITGIISSAPINAEQASLVAQMNVLQTHRGPDGEGVLSATHIQMAMRRLSIIDLSTGGQPLYNEDRSLAIIANGEVYNFVELRKSLESRGHRFATKSDCENILHLYEEYGDDCVHHLRGMYAFALWDANRRRVLLVRDRMGEKPLYLAEREGEVVFASELRTLVQAGVVPVELDPGAIHLYFHYGYVPEPKCPFKGVRKLPAGHLLTIDVDAWRVEQRCYWRMEDASPVEGDPAALIREELERISELIIRSDVPVGVALSGGLDSSIIAVLAQKNYPGTMQAITVGYEGTPWQDERAMARELAQFLKMPLHEVELTSDDMVGTFAQMAIERDEPIAEIASTGMRAAMRCARERNIPVMLSGLGGDELFWGYAWVRAAALANKRRLAMHGGNGGAPSILEYLQVSAPPISYTGGVRWLHELGGLRAGLNCWRYDRTERSGRMRFLDLEPNFIDALETAESLYAPDFAQAAMTQDPMEQFTFAKPWPNIDVTMIRLVCETFLRQSGVAQGDRISMAASVEMRLPLVDYRLVELVIGLTKTQPSVANHAKKWLKEAVQDIVPPFVMNRRKRGFTPPWREWGRAWQNTIGKRLLDGSLLVHGVLSDRGAREMYQGLAPPTFTMPKLLSPRALALEIWLGEMDRLKGTHHRERVGV